MCLVILYSNVRRYWLDNNKDFGACHPPNISYRHTKSCFDVTYQSNSQGFRDGPWSQKSSGKKRAVVLGDSFMEGYGVPDQSRVSNLLEEQTKITHMNFSMSGNVSPTQYFLIYKNLAMNYEHDAIIIGVFPANDFIEDDLERGKVSYNTRYRPYWVGSYPDYTLTYYLDDMKKSELYYRGENYVKRFLKNFTYTYNVFAYFYISNKQSAFAASKSVSSDTTNTTASISSQNNDISPGYLYFSQEQYNKLIYSIESIKKMAPDKKIILLTIPAITDIYDFKADHLNPLGNNLSKFCQEQNIEYLDLLLHFSNVPDKEIQTLYYTCDGHWNSKGHEFVSKIINTTSYYKQN